MVSITNYWLTILIGTVLPIAVALVTKQNASPGLKATVLAALSAVSGALVSIQATGGTFEIKTAFIGFMVTWVTAVATHFGLLSPANVTGSTGSVAKAIPGGLG